MFYTIYKITNQINGKFYIGSHKTKDLNDSYMGSGKYLKYAQEKHGIENFKKEILFVFDNPDEMYAKEAEIVNKEFLAEENTYNLKVGGFGGFDHINDGSSKHIERCKRANSVANHEENGKKCFDQLGVEHYKKMSALGKVVQRKKYPNGTFFNKKHSDATKQKISESTKITSKGEKNSQYGKRWIYSPGERRSIKIHKNDPLPEGWLEGRKMKLE